MDLKCFKCFLALFIVAGLMGGATVSHSKVKYVKVFPKETKKAETKKNPKFYKCPSCGAKCKLKCFCNMCGQPCKKIGNCEHCVGECEKRCKCKKCGRIFTPDEAKDWLHTH